MYRRYHNVPQAEKKSQRINLKIYLQVQVRRCFLCEFGGTHDTSGCCRKSSHLNLMWFHFLLAAGQTQEGRIHLGSCRSWIQHKISRAEADWTKRSADHTVKKKQITTRKTQCEELQWKIYKNNKECDISEKCFGQISDKLATIIQWQH